MTELTPIYSDWGRVYLATSVDTELTRLRAEVEQLKMAASIQMAAYQSASATIARLEADARRWQFMHDNDMAAEYSDHITLVLNAPTGKPHGSLFRSVVDAAMSLSAPTGGGEG